MDYQKYDIFCDVIDNYGDAGFSLRLARTLSKKNIEVRLFCNDLQTLYTITDRQDLTNQLLKISKWPDHGSYQPSDIVVEAFSCRLPDLLNQKLREHHSLVIELEYLTAEKFSEDCHGLSSSADGLNSYFFFPGFSKKTGGLIFEQNLLNKINSRTYHFSIQKGIHLSLFSYKNHNITDFFHVLSATGASVKITVFKGLALDNVNNILKLSLKPGQQHRLDNLELNAVDMCSQDEYDNILLSSDLNCVRGEESVVRAMLCGKPFLWQIYPQSEQAHIIKLNSLFDRMSEYLPEYQDDIKIIRYFNLEYNGVRTNQQLPSLLEFLPKWEQVCAKWSLHLLKLGSLTDNLIKFIDGINLKNS
ncbi:MAG: elongation factor P maturation arginine rhamnosyltransferase EarP [Succinatimonas sp.]|nr:elongation factor P maturation arginine rhamnosyltransferase EarP [Succinatimonas sp.]